MKNLVIIIIVIISFISCKASKDSSLPVQNAYMNVEPSITQSLFDDKNAMISEENIQKILDGNYHLPKDLRVTFVQLKGNQQHANLYWLNEDYLKSQQQYLDLFMDKFQNSERVKNIEVLPDFLISSNPSFTNIREAAVRTQSDIVVIYAIDSDIYSQQKIFAKPVTKAFATIQLIVMDVRTGLVPFTTIVTKDFEDKKNESDFNAYETNNRVKNEAVLLCIDEIGNQIEQFLLRNTH